MEVSFATRKGDSSSQGYISNKSHYISIVGGELTRFKSFGTPVIGTGGEGYLLTINLINVQITWTNVKSALVSAFITAILAGAGYVVGVGDIFKIDVHALVNVVSLASLTALVSIIKSFLTTDSGKFVGAVAIK